MEYIIVAEDSAGSRRALYYLRSIGRRRIYRRRMIFRETGLVILKYKTESYAQKICDHINRVYNDNFKVKPA